MPGVTQPSPQVVGAAFVQQYYCVLYQSPDQVHKFYQDSSILSHQDSNGSMTSVTSLQAINDKLLSLDFSNYTAEIESVDSQASYKDGVLVLVTGSLTGKDYIRHKFTQSFFLAPQERGGYVVLNDIFRFVDSSQPRDVNQVILNSTNDDASVAASTPEPEPILLEEPLVANGVDHEASEEDTNESQETSSHQENGTLAIMDRVAADPEVHVGQSDDQPVHEATASVYQEDGPKKSYASIVMVYKDSSSPVPVSVPVSKPKASLPKADNEKADKTNAEKQSILPSKTSSTSEAPVCNSNNLSENNTIDVEGYSIYIRNLPLSTTPDQVEEEFGKFGPIRPGGVQVRNHKVERFCFGFVEFESLDSMLAAIKGISYNYWGSSSLRRGEEDYNTSYQWCGYQ
ncbi:Nuclear transport factor 2 [Apostasia shenzhenica]|uniref:Nuclear transport factor 2 n=1 Tax=Apostasia shenzhenica TaxID=1088818 RepID=A0A2I0A2F2_9ASPA|nr:Nuclear transport factor 2 [Apostasia shenzhenica]